VLASCANRAPPSPAAAPTEAQGASAAAPLPPLVRGRSRWLPVPFSELPGWEADRLAESWPALRLGCTRPAPDWAVFCRQASALVAPDDAALRAWLQQRLQAYRVEALDGVTDGLLTGYFEPLVEASRQPRGAYRVPLYGPPPDLASRRPYWTRRQIDTLPAAKASLRGREIAYVADPLEALVLHIQGSGRLHIKAANGGEQLVRAAFAGSNDLPYKSVGRWLIEQGELGPDQASWPAIRAWAQRNPKRVDELLWSNPRFVFFREEPLPDPSLGPRGAQGVPLTPGRSIAVDPQSIPYGTPVWLVSTEPLSSTPLRRLAMAQDTGSAITGAVRADYFWGWGAAAEQQAGRMKQPLRMWALWPKAVLRATD
jgi:membrane-bound lytic murein transglycosylase A